MNLEEIIKKNVAKPNFDELAAVMALDSEPFKLAELTKVCTKIKNAKARYDIIENATGVPWDFVGTFHFMEASLRFEACLHNGEPWNKKTTLVPKGRGPWSSFEEAAIDALKYDKLANKPKGYWTLARMLEFAESYNGTGYRKRGILSPYVFAYTNLSDEMGKYVADHIYDATKPHNRPSVGAILLMLKRMEMPTVAFDAHKKVLEMVNTQMGVKEFVKGSNPQIETYHKFATVKNDKGQDDSVPWCSALMCWAFESAGLPSTNSAQARSWLKYGRPTLNPIKGDIVVFWRESKDGWKGHVGLFMGFDANGDILVAGGNQSDMVCIKAYSRDQLLGFRTY